MFEGLQEVFHNCILSELVIEDNMCLPMYCDCLCNCHNDAVKLETCENDLGVVKCGSRTFKVPENQCFDDYTLYFIGSEGLTFTNIMLNWNKNTYYSYNPETKVCRKESLNVNKVLMKRYFLIEKVKDAKIVGILLGTLGVANYLQV